MQEKECLLIIFVRSNLHQIKSSSDHSRKVREKELKTRNSIVNEPKEDVSVVDVVWVVRVVGVFGEPG